MIFLEIKSVKGKLTERQEALHKELRAEGHFVSVVRSVDDVIDALNGLGVITKHLMLCTMTKGATGALKKDTGHL